jgi:tetratricopeptide (TPR) repeat protein
MVTARVGFFAASFSDTLVSMRIGFLLVLLLAVPSSSLRDLGSPYARTRERAIARLAAEGPEVERLLIEAYAESDFLTRAGILDVLAARRSDAALRLVFEDLETPSGSVREAQARVVAALGDAARGALREKAAESRRARRLLALATRALVERTLLEKTLGPGLHYDGQFARLVPDRAISTEVLLEIVANGTGGYRFTVPVRHVVDMVEIREIAADALRDVAEPEHVDRILALLQAVRKESEDAAGNFRVPEPLEGVENNLAFVLYDLGHHEPAERLAIKLREDLLTSGWSEDRSLFRIELAMCLSRMGRHAQAAALYREHLREEASGFAGHAGAAYNLACVLSLHGDLLGARSALLQACRLEAANVDLALVDGDLRAVREAYPDLKRDLLEAAKEAEEDD